MTEPIATPQTVVPKKVTPPSPLESLRINMLDQYKKTLNNYFADDKKAMQFMSAVINDIQRNPVLLECTQSSLINAYVTMASLQLMPSGVSGEAYVIPYRIGGVMTAQFQLGYQGIVTLCDRAGVRSIIAEIVRQKDVDDKRFTYINGVVKHEPDIFDNDRGEPIGAYCIIETRQGGKTYKVMNKKEIETILAMAKSQKKLSDPEMWRWKKTVLKQAAKLISKNDMLAQGLDADNTTPEEKKKQQQLQEPTTNTLPLIESTEWRDKLRNHLMSVLPDAPDEGAAYFTLTNVEEYPSSEEKAKVAYGQLLANKK